MHIPYVFPYPNVTLESLWAQLALNLDIQVDSFFVVSQILTSAEGSSTIHTFVGLHATVNETGMPCQGTFKRKTFSTVTTFIFKI